MSKRGESASRQWILDHVAYDGDDCLIWPFSNARGGYGHFVYLGKGRYAHRYMCELKHGPAPSDTHEAAHGCGNSSCVNPHHISWKTRTENKMDCRLHGTHVKHRTGNIGKVTREQAAEIRSLKPTKTLKELAEQFGLSQSGVANICTGRRQSRPSKVLHWTPQEDDRIRDCARRGLNFTQMSREIGRSTSAIMGRAYRIGIRSGQPQSGHPVGKSHDPA